MNESMYKYFKPGIIHFMAYPSTIRGEGPILETIKKIACDEYFTAIEVTWIKDDEIRKCISCLTGCWQESMMAKTEIACSINPACGDDALSGAWSKPDHVVRCFADYNTGKHGTAA